MNYLKVLKELNRFYLAAASRYKIDDRIIYQNKRGKIISVDKKRDILKWVYVYRIQLDNGEKLSVNANELKLEKSTGRKRISFKTMTLPHGWKFIGYKSSAYYDFRKWSFNNDKGNGIKILSLNNDSEFRVEYSINHTIYHGTEFINIKTPKEAEEIAYKLMEKLDKGEIEAGFKKPNL